MRREGGDELRIGREKREREGRKGKGKRKGGGKEEIR